MASMKKNLQCASCGWRFARSAAPKLCPQCGKESVIESVVEGAQEIIDEIDSMERQLSR